LNEVVIPAGIREIDLSALLNEIRQFSIRFEGPPLFLTNNEFVLSVDSRGIYIYLSLIPNRLCDQIED
jgi:hypothetical protein